MISFIKKILRYPRIVMIKKRFTGKGSVYLTTRIVFSGTANKSNIYLSTTSRVHGCITVCDTGQVYVGNYSQVGPNSVIRCVDSVRIGDYTMISTNVVISDNNNHPINPLDREEIQKTSAGSDLRSMKYSDHSPIIIGNRCWIGEYSRICKGVSVGDGSIVAANAVVTKDVPANTIVAGNPARIVKSDIDQSPRIISFSALTHSE